MDDLGNPVYFWLSNDNRNDGCTEQALLEPFDSHRNLIPDCILVLFLRWLKQTL